MSVAPGDIDDVRKDLGRGLARLGDRKPEYDLREAYQLGTRKEVIAHPQLQGLLEKYGENFQLNYASVPAVALNDRQDLLGIRVGDTGPDALLSERFWIPNDLDDDADDIHLKANYLGDFYAVLELIEDDADQTDGEDETATGIGTVELTPKDPRNTVIVYQRTNSRRPDFGLTLVPLSGGEYRAYVYYDDVTFRFDTDDVQNKDFDGFDPKRYLLATDEAGDPITVENPGGFPVLHWRPDSRPYGTPVNAKAYGPQDAITKLVATLMASVDYHGLPERYALLDKDREFGSDIERDFNDDFPDAGTAASSAKGKPKVTSKPGGFAFLEGVTSTGTYATADSKGFTDPLALFIRAAATLTRTPLYEFDLEGTGEQSSGESRRRADAPITKHALKLDGQYGAVWAAAGAWVLRALGQTAERAVTAVWAPPETATDKEGLELAGAKVSAGIPPRQALIEAGYTAAQLDEWWGPEVPGEMRLSPDLLVKIAGALQQLGQARGLGAVGGEEIVLALAPYFGTVAQPEPDPVDDPGAAA